MQNIAEPSVSSLAREQNSNQVVIAPDNSHVQSSQHEHHALVHTVVGDTIAQDTQQILHTHEQDPVQVDTVPINNMVQITTLQMPTSDQTHVVLSETVELVEQGAPTASQQMTNHLHTHPTSPIDSFLESISLPIMQPLLEGGAPTPLTHSTREDDANRHINPTPGSSKRHGSRLAQKAASNVGKDAIQVAHDLLVKKLGDLSGEEQQQNPDVFEFYAQHFERPIDKSKMEAIKVLIEQGNNKQKKDVKYKRAMVAPGLVA